MIVSTRGRYALRVMIDLAENQEKEDRIGVGSIGRMEKRGSIAGMEERGQDTENTGIYIPMKDVANRQGISLKYLERILPVLTRNNMVEGVQGKGGGYRLCRRPEEYRVGDILRLTEGDLAPVACLECGAAPCDRKDTCRTLAMWSEFHQLINNYFDNITLADLIRQDSI